MTTALFDRDVRAYLAVLPALLGDNEGRFVLIGQGEVAGLYDTHEEAMVSGYEKFGTQGFLAQEIARTDLEMGQEWLETCPF